MRRLGGRDFIAEQLQSGLLRQSLNEQFQLELVELVLIQRPLADCLAGSGSCNKDTT